MEIDKLTDLIPMDSSDSVLDEAVAILGMISAGFDTAPVSYAFSRTVTLYEGGYPGYRACNTDFHDLRHTTDTFLAMVRLLHGAMVDGRLFSHRQMVLALVAAMLHDVGYIQEESDSDGTGAKHTVSHIRRSMNFVLRHGRDFGLSNDEIPDGQAMILCTDLSADLDAIAFSSGKIGLLGKMLGTADLLAQMADRTYLEKLLFLYHEFSEARVGDYTSEIDLLRKTASFYDFIDRRLKKTLDATDRFMRSHFISRWDLPHNLYREAIDRQKTYLLKILNESTADPRLLLRRDGIVDEVRKKFGENR